MIFFLRAILIGCTLVMTMPAGLLPQDLGLAVQGDWIRATSKSYRLVGQVDTDDARELLLRLEALRQLFASGHSAAHVSGTGEELETVLVAFATRKGFASYSPWPSSRGIGGYFHSDGTTAYLGLDASQRGTWKETALHESVHAFLVEIGHASAPLWLQEGLAEFYSTLRLRDEETIVGWPVQRHLDVLRSHRWLPWNEILAMSRYSSGYDSALQGELYYAQSWLLIHYLLLGEERSQKLTELLDRLDSHDDEPLSASRLETLLGMATGDLTTQLRRWVRAVQWPYFRLPRKSSAAPPETVQLSEAEVLARLGDLHANRRGKSTSLARRHFEAALRLDPTQRLAIAGMLRMQAFERRP